MTLELFKALVIAFGILALVTSSVGVATVLLLIEAGQDLTVHAVTKMAGDSVTVVLAGRKPASPFVGGRT